MFNVAILRYCASSLFSPYDHCSGSYVTTTTLEKYYNCLKALQLAWSVQASQAAHLCGEMALEGWTDDPKHFCSAKLLRQGGYCSVKVTQYLLCSQLLISVSGTVKPWRVAWHATDIIAEPWCHWQLFHNFTNNNFQNHIRLHEDLHENIYFSRLHIFGWWNFGVRSLCSLMSCLMVVRWFLML